MTTLTALATRPAMLLHPGARGRGFLLGFLGTLAAGFMVLAALSIAVSALSAGRIMPGVRVASIEVGGLDRAAAEAKLRAELPSLGAGSIAVTVDGEAVRIPFASLGRSYQLDETLDGAFGVARTGDLAADAVARLRVLAVPASVPAIIAGGDGLAIGNAVRDVVARFSETPTSAAVTYQAGVGFVAQDGAAGVRIDAMELRSALLNAVGSLSGEQPTIAMAAEAVAPEVTTDEAEVAARRANLIIAEPLDLQAGEQSFALEPEALAGLISFGSQPDGTYAPLIDESALVTLVEPLAAEVATEPKDAGFEWGPNGVTGVVPAVEGLELDVAASVSSIVDALQDRASAAARRSIPLAVVGSAPALTTQAAEAAAPQMRMLSTWTTYYVPGEGNFWNANIHIAAWDVDKMVIAPGEWFEFWQDIGPVTLERGYGYGGAIIGGRSVPNGALAGGICSTSTTLFNAAMRSGLEIGERTNHSYYIERYPLGLDATVLKTDTWETDMTFRNDTANPVVIRSYTGNGWVRFDIWGVPDGRTVSLSAPTTWGHGTAVWTTVVNRNLAPGTSRIVEYPHDGFNSSVTRWVRDAEGNVIHENTWVSHYRTVNGITEVGPRARDGGGDDDEDGN